MASKLLNHESLSYVQNRQLLEDANKMAVELSERRKILQALIKKPFKKKENAVEAAKKSGDMDLYNERLAVLTKEKEEVEEAKKELELNKTRTTQIATRIKGIKAQLEEAEKQHAKWATLKEKQEVLKKQIVDDKTAYEQTKEKAIYFQDLFGKENFFIELQNHGIQEEFRAMRLLAKMSRELNIPVVAANDVHILRNTEEDLMQRQLMRSLRYNKWEERRIGDDQLYMKTDEELASALYRILPDTIVNEAMSNIKTVVDACNVEFPEAEHYPVFVSDKIGETAEDAIVRLCREAIPKFFPGDEWTEVREKRLTYELGVINKMGYANYHLIVQDFLGIGRKLGRLSKESLAELTSLCPKMNLQEFMDYVNTHMTEEALSIGPGRGSAAGSLVCFLLGITSIDPIKYDLLFERFLNIERVSMPKILGV